MDEAWDERLLCCDELGVIKRGRKGSLILCAGEAWEERRAC